jgi:hypothetical protein
MDLRVKLIGGTPLVMHNPRLADPRDPIVKEIKGYTAKGSKQTEADREEVSRLEWLGGLYTDEKGNPVVSTWAVVRTFEEAAKVTKHGKDVIRAVRPHEPTELLDWDGSGDIRKLWPDPRYVWTTVVGNQRNKIIRTRPIFRRWEMTLDISLLEDVMNLSTFKEIAEAAGRIEGLLDARKLGNGRFTVEVSAMPKIDRRIAA